MHGLETIIAMNKRGADTTCKRSPEATAAKQRSRDQHFSSGYTLADEIDETIELLEDAPVLTVYEQLLLRFAKELKVRGADGPAEIHLRAQR